MTTNPSTPNATPEPTEEGTPVVAGSDRILLRVFRCDNKLTITSTWPNPGSVLYEKLEHGDPPLNEEKDLTYLLDSGWSHTLRAVGENLPPTGPHNPWAFSFVLIRVDRVGSVKKTYWTLDRNSNGITDSAGVKMDETRPIALV